MSTLLQRFWRSYPVRSVLRWFDVEAGGESYAAGEDQRVD